MALYRPNQFYRAIAPTVYGTQVTVGLGREADVGGISFLTV
jgi:hypothetical protein